MKMKKVNIDKWKNFKIYELFITETKNNKLQVPTGASIPKRNLLDGKIPRISATNINNGILGYYEDVQNKCYRVFENFISVSFLGTIFYHPYRASLDMKIHCLKLINRDLNKYIAFYFISIIKKVIEETEYNDQISSTVLPFIEIKLPVTSKGEPDWQYMEDFIKGLESRERESTSNISMYLEQSKPSKINVRSWKRFYLYDENLFEIFSGTKLDKKNMTTLNPSINFVGRSNLNNGITEKVDYIDGIKPYQKGDITLALGGHYLGSCFIQPKEFYTSQNVNVLRAKKDISFNCKVFISTMILRNHKLITRHLKTN